MPMDAVSGAGPALMGVVALAAGEGAGVEVPVGCGGGSIASGGGMDGAALASRNFRMLSGLPFSAGDASETVLLVPGAAPFVADCGIAAGPGIADPV